MYKKLIIGLFTSILLVPNAYSSEDSYGVITYGILDSDSERMGNLGLALGTNISDSFSVEISYASTINEADLGSDSTLSTTSIGLFAVYQSEGDTYFKGRVGFSKIDFDMDIFGINFSDDTSGLSYGVGIGIKAGEGAIELEYTILPDLDDFLGVPANIGNDYIGIGYKFSF